MAFLSFVYSYQARINALIADRQQKENENKKLKDELSKMVREIERPVAELESEIRKLTEFHAKKSEVCFSEGNAFILYYVCV